MSTFTGRPWSNNNYAPRIPYSLYFAEKANFAGALLGAIFYGIVIVMFFQSVGALLDSVNRKKGGVKWGLVVHAAAMFSFATIYTATSLDVQSISYIDNRAFPGIDGLVPPGPLGYQISLYSKAISLIPNIMIVFNNWLADGFLLFRCYTLYARNYWVIAFPCLMYLASVGMGIRFIYQTSQPDSIPNPLGTKTGIPYFSISVSLNILITLLILARLFLYSRNVRNAVSSQTRSGAFSFIATVLVESSAIYAINSILFIVPWGANSWVAGIFLPLLAQTQVIAPLLITLRVADHRALTSENIVSWGAGSTQFRFQGQSTTGNIETIPDIDVHRDKVELSL